MKLFILFFLGLIVGINPIKAMPPDTLTVVNFFGKSYAVKDGTALTQRQLKLIIRANPEAFNEFKKARQYNNLSITFSVLGGATFFLTLISETPEQFWAGILGTATFMSCSIILQDEPRSKHIRETVRLYNNYVISK